MKTIPVIKEDLQPKGNKENEDQQTKAKQVVIKEKAYRAKTMEKSQQIKEGIKEVKDARTQANNKKASVCSTQGTDGMITSRDPSRLRVNNQKATTLKTEISQLQKARLNTEEKRSKEPTKELVTRQLDMARTMPVLKMSDFKSPKEAKIPEVIAIEEKGIKEEKDLFFTEIFESQFIDSKGRSKVTSPRSKINLKVVTNR